MSPGVPTKVVGACAGLTGFAVALIAGLAADNPAEDVLFRALVAMLACQIVGGLAGWVCERVVRDAIREYQSAHPVNNSSTPAPSLSVDTPVAAPPSA